MLAQRDLKGCSQKVDRANRCAEILCARILETDRKRKRESERERKRETPTTYFVDTMGHKCVATGPVDIRQADCSLCHCAPDCRLFEAWRAPRCPPAGRVLSPNGGHRDQRWFAEAA